MVVSMIRKYHNHKQQTRPWHREKRPTITCHQEDTQGKETTSSLFPFKMIAKLEWTQSNAQQNIEQLQNKTWCQNEDISILVTLKHIFEPRHVISNNVTF